MEFAFPWPLSTGGWLAFTSACITILLGLVFFAAPRTAFLILHLRTAPDHPEAVAEGRGRIAGFYLGLGLACILFDQPLIYMALGASWTITAIGRLLSVLVDGGNTVKNWLSLASELVLAGLCLVYVLGYVP